MTLTRPQVDSPQRFPNQAARFRDVRSLTEALAEPLSAEDQTVQSMPDVSPTKWHRAHTTWFFETFILETHVSDYTPYHPAFGFLFNSYYEAVGPRHARPDRGLLSRPGVEEIAEYRRLVDDHVLRLIASGLDDAATDLLELGLHHEQQHQELLLMDIKHVLSLNPLDPVYRPCGATAERHAVPLTWAAHEAGLVEIGHPGGGFAFDNEMPTHLVHLAPFELATRPVTNGEWLEFITDDGYRRPELWLSDGWAAVQSHGWEAPLYWRDEGTDWSAFTLGGRRSVEPAEPVCHVSYYEADAFARWSGARLPSEGEWEHAVRSDESCLTEHFELASLQPCASAGGLGASVGEVWEWTSSAYLPYPGYRQAPGAVGEYNGKFMVNQHVLRGGACVTPPGHRRPTYRNFFPPASRWPFAGVRLARDL